MKNIACHLVLLGLLATGCDKKTEAAATKSGLQEVQGVGVKLDWPEKLAQADVVGSTMLMGDGVTLVVRAPLGIDPKSLDEALAAHAKYDPPELKVTRQDASPGGYVYVTRAKTETEDSWQMKMLRQVGSKPVYCEVTSADANALKLGEKICLAMVP